tara:strand:- start:1297 stop:1863 length:567 start_codon:yes stop_codon:yes gene_type:complete
MFNLNPLFKLKNKFLSNEKQKYFNRFSFTQTRSQQNFWYFKQLKKQNNNKTKSRSFLKYLRKNIIGKHNYSQFALRQKSNKYLSNNDFINYASLQAVSISKVNLSLNSLSLFVNSQTVKHFSLTPINYSLLSYCLVNYIQTFNTKKNTVLLTSYASTTVNSFQFYKTNFDFNTSTGFDNNFPLKNQIS